MKMYRVVPITQREIKFFIGTTLYIFMSGLPIG